jgi:hypothetical protein
MHKHHTISNIYSPEDSLKIDKVKYIERKIGTILSHNRALSVEERRDVIINIIKDHDLSVEQLFMLSAECLLRVDNGRVVMAREENLKPLLDAGVKSLRNAHMNASKPRPGGLHLHLNKIKSVMKRLKAEGKSFKDFFSALENKSIDKLIIAKKKNQCYKIYHFDFRKNPRTATAGTIQRWYSQCDQVK